MEARAHRQTSNQPQRRQGVPILSISFKVTERSEQMEGHRVLSSITLTPESSGLWMTGHLSLETEDQEAAAKLPIGSLIKADFSLVDEPG